MIQNLGHLTEVSNVAFSHSPEYMSLNFHRWPKYNSKRIVLCVVNRARLDLCFAKMHRNHTPQLRQAAKEEIFTAFKPLNHPQPFLESLFLSFSSSSSAVCS
jgi:hypothetical protein